MIPQKLHGGKTTNLTVMKSVVTGEIKVVNA